MQDNIFLGGGKGFQGQGNKIFEFQTLGGGKEIGTSNLVNDLNILKTSEEAGTGILSKGFQRITGNILEGSTTGIKKVVEKASNWVDKKVLGNIHQIEGEEGVFSFLGSTKPVIRIYKKGGVSYIIKNPDIQGNIFLVSKEPEIISSSSLGTGVKTSLDKAFSLTSLEQKSILSQVVLPKTSSSTIPYSKSLITGSSILETKESTPSMVGGTGEVTSAYAGTNQYERSESTGLITSGQLSLFGGKNRTSHNVNYIQEDLTKEKNNLISNEGIKLIQPTKEKQILFELSKQNKELKSNQAGTQAQVSRQIQKQIQKKVPVIIKIIPSSNKIAKELSGEGEENLFEIYGRRKGTFNEIGTAKSEKEAKDILEKFLGGTLGASGKIKKGNEFLRFNELSFNNEYTKGKKDESLIVQLNKFRLKKRDSQVREINSFKRNKTKKVKWF
jgi:hypothetical protein